MKVQVHILATCRSADLIDATTFVFRSIRTGFPTAKIVVWDNANSTFHLSEVRETVKRMPGGGDRTLVPLPTRLNHWEWIKGLVMNPANVEPIWLCDTDMAFWAPVEEWEWYDCAIAGRRMPKFYDAYSKCLTLPRLHTCLMWIDPAQVRMELEEQAKSFDLPVFGNEMADPFKSFFCFDPDGRRLFFDTCSILAYAVRRHEFTAEENACFDHLHCGTYVDVMETAYPGIGKGHRTFLEHPSLLRGKWPEQESFFKSLKEPTHATNEQG